MKDIFWGFHFVSNPPASEASREVANLTERKNPHTPKKVKREDKITTLHLEELTLTQVEINIFLLYRASALLFERQDWLKGEFQIEVLNLIPKQMENRLGTLD